MIVKLCELNGPGPKSKNMSKLLANNRWDTDVCIDCKYLYFGAKPKKCREFVDGCCLRCGNAI